MTPSASGRLAVRLALTLAIAMPALLAANWPPSPTLVGQCVSLAGWGMAVVVLGIALRPHAGNPHDGMAAWPMHVLVASCLAAALVSTMLSNLPMGIAIGNGAMLLVFALLLQMALSAPSDEELLRACLDGLLFGALVAGLLNAAIGFVQVAWPDVPEGLWIAKSGIPGRAVGNLRQPNHLSSLLLWALIALAALCNMRRLRLAWLIVGGALLYVALVLTASRTAVLGVVLLTLWGLLDRRAQRPVRGWLIAAPLAMAVAWAALAAWSHATGHAFGAEDRLAVKAGGDISSSRFAIWSDTLTMIRREPLGGVGFGEYNLAWTLTELPNRPVAFFDHSHNLPLQLLVEFGLPMGLLMCVALVWMAARAGRRAWQAEGEIGSGQRAAFMMVLLIGLHSMLEYPLWYAYFLFPTAFAWGLALARRPALTAGAAQVAPDALRRLTPSAWIGLGVAIVMAAISAMLDYRQIVVIYEPPEGAASLEQRIERGQRSLLFGHHADYAAATAFGEPEAPLPASQQLAFRRAPHHLLDVRLMIAWAQALEAEGKDDQARWLAARIREFRNPGADEFFAPCAVPAEAVRSFQCQPPQRVWHWREFVAR